jgi:hypothetical protein
LKTGIIMDTFGAKSPIIEVEVEAEAEVNLCTPCIIMT